MFPSISSVLSRLAGAKQSALLTVALAVGLPAAAIGVVTTGWFGQATGGAQLMASGESIGSLPCFLTPDETAPLPGATPEQMAMQALPAVQVDIASNLVWDVVQSALGNGYCFVGPSLTNEGNARLRTFGDALESIDSKPFSVRTNTLSWRIGSAFAGSSLTIAGSGKPLVMQISPATLDIPLPIDSTLWAATLATTPITLTLTRADGAVASLQLALSGNQLVVTQNVP
jgi:hypothetical protein